ncbi:urocortin [Sphaerodactylus townsendi]|uniref:urocortin n=1 Tax=Sphaerodactylus townsendi TaxID=933632 RepID=UPI0020266E9B|nr:urocortin [Sphaerodactylus townsendi]XP_048339119.1 urocortin [Sphaerodactylus townsendi]
MKRVPLPILVASLLLVSGSSLGAGRVPDFDGNAESGLSLRLRRLLLGEDRAPRSPLAPPLPAPGHDEALAARSLVRAGPPGELRRRLRELSERLKRQQPVVPMDPTFRILLLMLEIARAESQREQAEQNRLIFDSVGK